MRRLVVHVAALAGLLALLAGGVDAESYQVVRKVRLLTKPSSAQGHKLKTLHPPEVVTGTDSPQHGNYIEVRDGSGDVGWVYEPYLEEVAESEQPTPMSPVTPGGPTPAGLQDASLFAIPNCPPEGNPSPRGSRYEALKALNRLKNRTLAPADGAVRAVELSRFLAKGNDEERWQTGQAVELVAFVKDVKPGGPETCNCKSDDEQYYDTHIELTSGPNSRMLPMVVEVTPAWRGLMASVGRDWSTESLESSIEGQWVKFRGWLFWDGEHFHNAQNTNPDGSNLWRRTAWEIHPVTAIELVATP